MGSSVLCSYHSDMIFVPRGLLVMDREYVDESFIPHTIPEETEIERREEMWPLCLHVTLQSM